LPQPVDDKAPFIESIEVQVLRPRPAAEERPRAGHNE
jgi:hypothetical protein